jgi:hypothetical protein
MGIGSLIDDGLTLLTLALVLYNFFSHSDFCVECSPHFRTYFS